MADLATAVRVLCAAAADPALWASQAYRGVRVAVQPLLARAGAQQFGGVDAAAYASAAARRKRAALERNAAKLEDQRFIQKTQLRAGRMQRLEQLAAQGGGAAASLPLLLDGVADPGFVPSLKAPGAAILALCGGAAGGVVSGGNVAGAAVSVGVVTDVAAAPASNAGNGDLRNGVGGSSCGIIEGASSTHGTSAAAGACAAPIDNCATRESSDAAPPPQLLHSPRACYTCKARFRELHAFYDTLCPRCAALNWAKRHATANLQGRIALVTGARVKIGFNIALKLLRCGATVIATTRFPVDAAERFSAQPDFDVWRGRLEVVGLDLRHLPALETFCATLVRDLPRLDILINNACQTVRRPAAYYAHLLPKETAPATQGARCEPRTADLLRRDAAFTHSLEVGVSSVHGAIDGAISGGASARLLEGSQARACSAAGLFAPPVLVSSTAADDDSALLPLRQASSAVLSQLVLTSEDALMATPGSAAASAALPAGLVDVNAQQLDLRTHNSWLSRLADVSTPELAEVMAINAMAPFILCARLKSLMIRGQEGCVSDSAPGVGVFRGSGSQGALSLAEVLMQQQQQEGAASQGASGGTPAPQARGHPVGGAAKRPRRDAGGGHALEGNAAVHRVPASKCRFIVNVSSMEGKFYREKMPAHPHTNAAKAALNMLTRTSAGDYAERCVGRVCQQCCVRSCPDVAGCSLAPSPFRSFIYMTAVDTGWINEENPLPRAAATAARHNFATPLDEVDAAARVLDPVIAPLADAEARGDGTAAPTYGAFLKDYFSTEW